MERVKRYSNSVHVHAQIALGVQKYRSTHSLHRRYMGVSGEFKNPAALSPGNNPVPTGWVEESFWELL